MLEKEQNLCRISESQFALSEILIELSPWRNKEQMALSKRPMTFDSIKNIIVERERGFISISNSFL